jgi:hypothetical protein
MFRSLCFGAVFILAGALVAIAETKVDDWTISRNQNNKDQCVAVRNYVDDKAGNLNSSVIFSLLRDKIIIGLGYQAWKWDKGERKLASLSLDGNELIKNIDWTATVPQTLTAVTNKSDALMLALAKAKKLSIKFDDGNVAEFNIPRAGDVMAALKTCVDYAK